MIVLAQSGGNASVCGCSSMVEQQLPKLPASAQNLTPSSKTPHVTSVSIQTLSFRAQIENDPGKDGNPPAGSGHKRMEVRHGLC